MRRMYSQKQIEALAKEVAKAEIEKIFEIDYDYEQLTAPFNIYAKSFNIIDTNMYLSSDGLYIGPDDEGLFWNSAVEMLEIIGEIHIGQLKLDGMFFDNTGLLTENNDQCVIKSDGTIELATQTHSLSELDSTLQQLIEDAVVDGGSQGVACTAQQWAGIKELLDKSLFINYIGFSMIKTSFDGLNNYVFGYAKSMTGSSLELTYNDDDEKLFAILTQI